MARRQRREEGPLHFRFASGGPFAFAGLWTSRREEGTGEAVESFTIVTTRPNELVAPVHDRMPVILRPVLEDAWLDVGLPRDHLLELLQPYEAAGMTATLASRFVNSVANDGPELLRAEPLEAAA